MSVSKKIDDIPKPILASILQYLTNSDLDNMSKMNKYILETILQYRLKERRTRQGQLYTFGSGEYGKLGNGRTDSHKVGIPRWLKHFVIKKSFKCHVEFIIQP